MQRSLEALVGHGSEARLVTQRTWLAIFPDTLDARLAIAVSATADEVRLAKFLEADGALALKNASAVRLDEYHIRTHYSFSYLAAAFLSSLSSVTAGGFTSKYMCKAMCLFLLFATV